MAAVLIVDDEKCIRATLQQFLESDGHTVATARDAATALSRLGAESFDIVVTDIVLPRTDGVTLLKSIRDTAPNVQVIMMTGEPTVETASEAVRHGAIDYLMKPVCKEAIRRSVKAAARVKAVDDERRRLLAANEEYRQNLEGLVSQRTRELQSITARLTATLNELRTTQSQIVQQERLRALGQMASGIAHDFNNALMPILGLTDHLLQEAKRAGASDDNLEILDTIRSAASDAQAIVRRLREFHRSDTELDAMPINLRRLAGHVIKLTAPAWRVQAQTADKTIRVINAVPEIPDIAGSESQIRELLTNLIMNAVHAIDVEGEIRVEAVIEGEIRVEAVIEGDTVNLTVADTGCGMPPDVAAHCMEPFFTTKGERGTGLGLAMCYGIAKRHGGRMSIDSAVGRGTRVTVNLPVARDDLVRREERPVPQLTGLHILVIDDEDRSLTVLRRCLLAEGHTVETFTDSAAGLQRLAAAPFDVLLTDRAMPAVSGDTVARHAKASCPTVPVIQVTGFGDLMNACQERPEGVDLVVAKPVTRESLQRALAAVLNRDGAPAAEAPGTVEGRVP